MFRLVVNYLNGQLSTYQLMNSHLLLMVFEVVYRAMQVPSHSLLKHI